MFERMIASGLVFATAWAGVGCGGVLYSAKITSVESKVEKAKEMGADTLAPYEYYGARERVVKAREEAARADYQDAIDLLDEADSLAENAARKTGEAKTRGGK